MTRKYQGGARQALRRAPQHRFGFVAATAVEQQLTECREGRRPIRVERQRLAQESLRAIDVAAGLLGSGEQAQRFDTFGVLVDDRGELFVRETQIAGLQQRVDVVHGIEQGRRKGGHRLSDPSFKAPCE